MAFRILVCGALLQVLLRTSVCFATAPELKDIVPTGGQRGTELEVSFVGERLQDAEEILCYDPGIKIIHLNEVTNKLIKAQVQIAPDETLGEHYLRVRTATGLSELRTFLVGSFPVVEEVEPNNEPAKAQPVSLNTTIVGVIKNEDVVRGAVVAEVDESSAAATAGLRQGDVILEINRQRVTSAEEAVKRSEAVKGDRVLLRVWSGGGSHYLVVEGKPAKRF